MTEPWLASGVIAVVRLPEPSGLRGVAAALATGGVAAVEITLTTPGALAAITDLASHGGGSVIGAGTVLDERAARNVIAAGARFVVSPTLDRSVVRYCRDQAWADLTARARALVECVAAARAPLAGAPA